MTKLGSPKVGLRVMGFLESRTSSFVSSQVDRYTPSRLEIFDMESISVSLRRISVTWMKNEYVFCER